MSTYDPILIPDLRPCDECGGEPKVEDHPSLSATHTGRALRRIMCKSCGIKTRWSTAPHHFWNWRLG